MKICDKCGKSELEAKNHQLLKKGILDLCPACYTEINKVIQDWLKREKPNAPIIPSLHD